MSVNGTGKDRKNSKPLSDSTSWSVKNGAGVVENSEGKKPLTGLNASEAFGYVRRLRAQGVFAAAVRS